MNPITSPATANSGPKLFTVGTLSYTQKGIVMLFFWLMWNDFCLTLFEGVQTFVNILFKNNGASNMIIGFSGSMFGILCLVINPVISTYSDRYRGKYGRRRPFLILAAPPLAVATMALPYMPELGKYMTRYPGLVTFWNHLGINGPVFFIGVCFVVLSLFNLVILSLFTYYWWDVVPEEVLGRFTGLSQIIATVARFIFGFFLLGYGEFHLKQLCFGLGLFFMAFYLVSTWRVKEGEYPPPEPRKSGNGPWSMIKTYFNDCYTKPRYLWVFGALCLYQLGNGGNMYQYFYVWKDLGLSLDTIGKFTSVTAFIPFVAGYSMGSLADKFKPVRLMGPCLLGLATTSLISYYCITGKWSLLICTGLAQIPGFAFGVFLGALTVEVYPRAKLGQFCSAASVMSVFFGTFSGPLLGLLFDHLKNNRMGYLWSAGFQVMSAYCFFRIYHTWKKLHPDQLLPGEAPEPA